MALNVLKWARVLSRIAGSQCWRAISRAVKEVLADGTQFLSGSSAVDVVDCTEGYFWRARRY